MLTEVYDHNHKVHDTNMNDTRTTWESRSPNHINQCRNNNYRILKVPEITQTFNNNFQILLQSTH